MRHSFEKFDVPVDSAEGGLNLVFGLFFKMFLFGSIDLLGHFDEVRYCVHTKYEGAALVPFVQVLNQTEVGITAQVNLRPDNCRRCSGDDRVHDTAGAF